MADILDAMQVNEDGIVAKVVGGTILVVVCVLELVVVVDEALVIELVLTEIEPALVALLVLVLVVFTVVTDVVAVVLVSF